MTEDPGYYIQGVLAGDRRTLSRTITLIESSLPAHQATVRALLEELLPHSGGSVRIGITGVPGAGKSTFIDSFGTFLTSRGYRVAVLTIDPSSRRSGGSILGDKTRMQRLAGDPRAYIRPSPAGETLGGVAGKTRETMLVCEAAGFDVVVVESVGVGQSETALASMVDFLLVLLIAGAGDQLQGIKKGILETADALAINKTDGDNRLRAEQAQRDYQAALQLLAPANPDWQPPVVTCSGLEEQGLEDIWQLIGRHRTVMQASGAFERRRQQQAVDWLHFLLVEGLKEWFYHHPEVARRLPALADGVRRRHQSATAAAGELLELLASET